VSPQIYGESFHLHPVLVLGHPDHCRTFFWHVGAGIGRPGCGLRNSIELDSDLFVPIQAQSGNERVTCDETHSLAVSCLHDRQFMPKLALSNLLRAKLKIESLRPPA
jgi:hypothetical protein